MRPFAAVTVALLGSLLVGCGGDEKPTVTRSKNKAAMRGDRASRDGDKEPAQDEEPAVVGEVEAPERAVARQPNVKPVKRKVERKVERKILYSGSVEAIVEDFDEAEEQLHDTVKEFKGYVANSEKAGTPGEPRWGTWTVRIPAEKFDDFVAAVTKLGELRRATRDSQDVTDAYYDTKAEVTNLEAREEALRKLYKEKIAGSKLTDLLELDRELNTVRGQINRRKGQLQRWDKLSEYATLIVRLQDRKGYVPDVTPEFRTRIGRTWAASIDALVWFAKGLLLVAVALAPWLFVFAVVVVPAVLIARRAARRLAPQRQKPTPRRQPEPPALPEVLPAEQPPPPAEPKP
jgi:hypothetical protein